MAALVKDKKSINDITKKNILFIVDEAHRSTAGEMLQNIKTAYCNISNIRALKPSAA